jgi:hypothetical protein
MTRAAAWRLVAVAAVLTPPAMLAQMATAARVEAPGWWPTERVESRPAYVGPAACATCHPAQAATQRTSSMARTAQRAAESDILRSRDALAFRAGAYSYGIARSGQQIVYTVSDGTRSLAAPLDWAFGVGKVGQSFLFERDRRLFESRVSYYDALHGLDLTPALSSAAPRDLEDAFARPIGDAEARRCFACHTTASATGATAVNLAELIPGVTCEACHGPGRTHAEAKHPIMNPRRLGPADSVDFCGSCHATFWDVKLAGERGIAALRSQPYRLQSSRCWGEGDARLTCVACHDPHKPLVRDAASYDTRCLACHVAQGSKPTATHPGRGCTIGTSNCTGCHMPKYEVPNVHSSFTDHLIRVVRTNSGWE